MLACVIKTRVPNSLVIIYWCQYHYPERSPPQSCDSCPFRTEGLWEDGELIRSSTLDVEFVGVTGSVSFMGGDNLVSNGAGTAGSGWRETNGTTFCALNLQAHPSLGATFVTMLSYQPEQRSDTNGTAAFEVGRMSTRTRNYLCCCCCCWARNPCGCENVFHQG